MTDSRIDALIASADPLGAARLDAPALESAGAELREAIARTPHDAPRPAAPAPPLVRLPPGRPHGRGRRTRRRRHRRGVDRAGPARRRRAARLGGRARPGGRGVAADPGRGRGMGADARGRVHRGRGRDHLRPRRRPRRPALEPGRRPRPPGGATAGPSADLDTTAPVLGPDRRGDPLHRLERVRRDVAPGRLLARVPRRRHHPGGLHGAARLAARRERRAVARRDARERGPPGRPRGGGRGDAGRDPDPAGLRPGGPARRRRPGARPLPARRPRLRRGGLRLDRPLGGRPRGRRRRGGPGGARGDGDRARVAGAAGDGPPRAPTPRCSGSWRRRCRTTAPCPADGR